MTGDKRCKQRQKIFVIIHSQGGKNAFSCHWGSIPSKCGPFVTVSSEAKLKPVIGSSGLRSKMNSICDKSYSKSKISLFVL